MMKINILFLLIWILIGCKQPAKQNTSKVNNINKTTKTIIKRDTLKYTYKKLRIEGKNCKMVAIMLN